MSVAEMRAERERKEKEMVKKYGSRHHKTGYDCEHDGDAQRFKQRLEADGAIDVDIESESDEREGRTRYYFSYFMPKSK